MAVFSFPARNCLFRHVRSLQNIGDKLRNIGDQPGAERPEGRAPQHRSQTAVRTALMAQQPLPEGQEHSSAGAQSSMAPAAHSRF